MRRNLLLFTILLPACSDSEPVASDTSGTSTGSTTDGTSTVTGDVTETEGPFTSTSTGSADATGNETETTGVCDEEVMDDCIQTEGAAQDPILDNCTGVVTDCEWSQCYGTYLKTWHDKTAEIRTTCLGIYPACVEHANIPYYDCIADCYGVLESCDDGDICTACTDAATECFNAC